MAADRQRAASQLLVVCLAETPLALSATSDVGLASASSRRPLSAVGLDAARARPVWEPIHLVLNVAVGGTWGGDKGVKEASFPYRMEVEHVRVSRRAGAPGEP